MPSLPLVAIIGRPNTGKSTLFNRLIRKRLAIESEVAGTTRDHIIATVEDADVDYLLIDTGGMGGGTEDKDFEDDVHAQSLLALHAADLIVFVVNGREETTKSDYAVAELLRKKKRKHVPVILAINKCDNPDYLEEAEHEFHKLKVGDEIIPVSAAHNIGTSELQESIAKHLKKLQFKKETKNEKPETKNLPRLALIGKPNVGKSSLINALMSEMQRKTSPKLVSDIPGTTRDATDTIIHYHEQEFVFVDTAGLRRPSRVEEDLEGLSTLRTMKALESCDIALLVLDATQPISKQDQRIGGMVTEAGKGLILLLNKTDLIDKEKRKEKMVEIRQNFLFCRYAPVLPCSAVTKEGLLKIFDLAMMVHRNRHRRIETRDLREFYESVTNIQPLGMAGTSKFLTQAEDIPPTFVLFVKNPKNVDVTQLRHLENRLRERFGFEGTPVRWVTKSSSRRVKKD